MLFEFNKLSILTVEAYPGYPIKIGSYAFQLCEGDSITINRDIEFIDSYDESPSMMQFSYADVASIVFPNSITEITSGMFQGLYKTIDELNFISFIDLDTGDYAEADFGEVLLPSSVLKIGESAFDGAVQIKSLIIPDTVLCAEDNIIYGWDNTQSVNVFFPENTLPLSANGYDWSSYWDQGTYATINYASSAFVVDFIIVQEA